MSFNPFFASAAGFPAGALSQVCGAAGSGKTEVVLKFLAENPTLRVAWVEENFSVYPCAFPLSQVSLDRIFFVDASQSPQNSQSSKDALWAVHQILQSQVFGVVVVAASILERDASVTLRRLQLLAEKSRTSVILLSETPIRSASWAIRLQLAVEREPRSGKVSVKVLKSKGEPVWQHCSA